MKNKNLIIWMAIIGILWFASVVPAQDKNLKILLDAVGGQAAWQSVNSLEINARGETFVVGESNLPDSGTLTGGTFTAKTTHDLAKDRFRNEIERNVSFNFWEFRPNPAAKYAEIVVGRNGYTDGTDNLLGLPSRPMFPAQVASTRKHQRLLNPHLILLDALKTKAVVKNVGTETANGVRYQKYEIADSVEPITFWLNAATNRIDKISTLENRPDLRDSVLEVFYKNWTNSGNVSFPEEVKITLSGATLQHEFRKVSAGGNFADALFQIPNDANANFRKVIETGFPGNWYGVSGDSVEQAVKSDEKLYAWGERSSQFLQTFTAIGVAFSGKDEKIVPVELASGVHLILGASHNSLVVEQEKNIVILEAPLSPERSKYILNWVRKQYPNKPVTDVVATHFHYDHASGLRQIAAENIRIVSSELNTNYLAEMMKRPSSIVPDDLSRNPKTPNFLRVGLNETTKLESPKNAIEIYSLPNRHASDWVYVFLPESGVLFVSDIHSPPFPPLSLSEFTTFAMDVKRHNLNVKTVAGGHGATQTGAEFEALIKQITETK